MSELSKKELERIGDQLIPLVQRAGDVLVSLYKTDVKIFEKSDGSPVTMADHNSHEILDAGLLEITPDIQVISEEGDTHKPLGHRFWLVDPLDGTKGFIHHTGNFCISIGLIENSRPVLGCIHVPLTGHTVIGFGQSEGFWVDREGHRFPLRKCEVPEEGYRVLVGMRSKKKGGRQDRFLEQFDVSWIKPLGSAIKFCELAKGHADLSVRFIESYEWDTAAGQAIIEACGGHVLNLDKTPLTYGKPNLLNSSFVVICDDNFNWS